MDLIRYSDALCTPFKYIYIRSLNCCIQVWVVVTAFQLDFSSLYLYKAHNIAPSTSNAALSDGCNLPRMGNGVLWEVLSPALFPVRNRGHNLIQLVALCTDGSRKLWWQWSNVGNQAIWQPQESNPEEYWRGSKRCNQWAARYKWGKTHPDVQLLLSIKFKHWSCKSQEIAKVGNGKCTRYNQVPQNFARGDRQCPPKEIDSMYNQICDECWSSNIGWFIFCKNSNFWNVSCSFWL